MRCNVGSVKEKGKKKKKERKKKRTNEQGSDVLDYLKV